MASVWEVASAAEPGDKIKWRGERSDVISPRPATVTQVDETAQKITVEAKGPSGADVGFWIAKDGGSEVWHGDKTMGAIEGVELVEKSIYTRRF